MEWLQNELIQGLAMITVVHLLAAASPGPDFVLVSQQALSRGKKAALLTSAGIALGLSIHIIYSIAGLATIIAHSEELLWGIKLLGGCYLIYLGIKGLRAKATGQPAVIEAATASPHSSATHSTNTQPSNILSSKKLLGMGFLCNALNPKAPIYFVAVFTIVLSPDMPLYQLAIYGLWMMILQFGWFALISCFLSKPKISQQFRKMGHWLDRLLGGAMLLLGLKVLLSK